MRKVYARVPADVCDGRDTPSVEPAHDTVPSLLLHNVRQESAEADATTAALVVPPNATEVGSDGRV